MNAAINTGRRSLLAASGALLMGAPAAATQVPTLTRTLSNPDADIIRTCAAHIVKLAAYNTHGGHLEYEDDPFWAPYEATLAAVSAARPQTVEGMVAIAQAAIAEAGADTKAEDRGFHSMEEHWSWNLMLDLLRLHGEA